MNISVTVHIDNRKLDSFSDLEEFVFQICLQIGRAILQKALEIQDQRLMAERDTERYRDKGLRKTCIKTKCGPVEYRRRVYLDRHAQPGERKSIYLLDELLKIAKIGAFSVGMCKLIASSVCESTYRATSRQVSELSGQPISAQGAWNVVQEMGRREQKRAEQNAKLAKESQGAGTIETELLYEEADGVWLKLQGKSRKKYGSSKEMKVGIAYDGVIWQVNKEGKKRRILNNKIAYAGFESAKTFRANKEGLIASRFKVKGIKLRVLNGDGASWIQKQKKGKTITVLDEFHRNKKIKECIRDPEKEKCIREVLYEGDVDGLLEYLLVAIDSVEDSDEEERLQELYDYYNKNKDSLLGYYDRGIEIPPTREPGVLHHARLGSMESNVFTLIGNRMKDKRCTWSVEGGNNLSNLLCAYHTTGMEELFAELPADPEKEEEWINEGRPLAAKENKLSVGKGYDYPAAADTQGSPYWLKDIAQIGGVESLQFIY